MGSGILFTNCSGCFSKASSSTISLYLVVFSRRNADGGSALMHRLHQALPSSSGRLRGMSRSAATFFLEVDYHFGLRQFLLQPGVLATQLLIFLFQHRGRAGFGSALFIVQTIQSALIPQLSPLFQMGGVLPVLRSRKRSSTPCTMPLPSTGG